jgi:hypothetical protein
MPLFIWSLLAGAVKSVAAAAVKGAVQTAAKGALQTAAQGAAKAGVQNVAKAGVQSAAQGALQNVAQGAIQGAPAKGGGMMGGLMDAGKEMVGNQINQTGLPSLLKGDAAGFLKARGQGAIADRIGGGRQQEEGQGGRAGVAPPGGGAGTGAGGPAVSPQSAAGRAGSTPGLSRAVVKGGPVQKGAAGGRPHHTAGDTNPYRGMSAGEAIGNTLWGAATGGGLSGISNRLAEVRATHDLEPYRASLKESLADPNLTQERKIELQGALASTKINKQPAGVPRGRGRTTSTMQVSRGPDAMEAFAATHPIGQAPEDVPTPRGGKEGEDQGLWRSMGTRALRGKGGGGTTARADEMALAKGAKTFLETTDQGLKVMHWMNLSPPTRRAVIKHYPKFAAGQQFSRVQGDEAAPALDPRDVEGLWSDDPETLRARVEKAYPNSPAEQEFFIKWLQKRHKGG